MICIVVFSVVLLVLNFLTFGDDGLSNSFFVFTGPARGPNRKAKSPKEPLLRRKTRWRVVFIVWNHLVSSRFS